MKWLILAIFAEVSVLLCLIFAFDGALHSLASARPTWDHAVVSVLYAAARLHFSRRRVFWIWMLRICSVWPWFRAPRDVALKNPQLYSKTGPRVAITHCFDY